MAVVALTYPTKPSGNCGTGTSDVCSSPCSRTVPVAVEPSCLAVLSRCITTGMSTTFSGKRTCGISAVFIRRCMSTTSSRNCTCGVFVIRLPLAQECGVASSQETRTIESASRLIWRQRSVLRAATAHHLHFPEWKHNLLFQPGGRHLPERRFHLEPQKQFHRSEQQGLLKAVRRHAAQYAIQHHG